MTNYKFYRLKKFTINHFCVSDIIFQVDIELVRAYTFRQGNCHSNPLPNIKINLIFQSLVLQRVLFGPISRMP